MEQVKPLPSHQHLTWAPVQVELYFPIQIPINGLRWGAQKRAQIFGHLRPCDLDQFSPSHRNHLGVNQQIEDQSLSLCLCNCASEIKKSI